MRIHFERVSQGNSEFKVSIRSKQIKEEDQVQELNPNSGQCTCQANQRMFIIV